MRKSKLIPAESLCKRFVVPSGHCSYIVFFVLSIIQVNFASAHDFCYICTDMHIYALA